MTRVFIAEDSAPMLGRLMSMMAEIKNIKVVGRSDSVGDTIKLVHDLHPDVAVLDVQLSDGSAIDALVAMKLEAVPPTIIMITNDPYPERIKRCMEAGADYFFDKSDGIEGLMNTLRDISKNKAALEGVGL